MSDSGDRRGPASVLGLTSVFSCTGCPPAAFRPLCLALCASAKAASQGLSAQSFPRGHQEASPGPENGADRECQSSELCPGRGSSLGSPEPQRPRAPGARWKGENSAICLEWGGLQWVRPASVMTTVPAGTVSGASPCSRCCDPHFTAEKIHREAARVWNSGNTRLVARGASPRGSVGPGVLIGRASEGSGNAWAASLPSSTEPALRPGAGRRTWRHPHTAGAVTPSVPGVQPGGKSEGPQGLPKVSRGPGRRDRDRDGADGRRLRAGQRLRPSCSVAVTPAGYSPGVEWRLTL